jgi:phosphoribosylformimino-5-aminoimidazole carboxamide ribotide isomerase
MELYPAIDLRGGRCVRLRQGDYGDETVYGDDPVALACALAEGGARWIHAVDLDAARTGEPANRGVIIELAAAVGPRTRVEAGGGVRSSEDAAALLDQGVARVVMGTAAVEAPSLLAAAARRWPGRVAAGIDHRGGRVHTRGWREDTGLDLAGAVRSAADHGAAAVIVTDITVDGTMTGPPLDLFQALLESVAVPLIASGGVGTLADVQALAGLRAGERSLAGVIVWKALYEGRFSIEEALDACRAGAPS